MACEDTRQLTEAQRVAGYQNQRTGVQRAIRPFSGRPTLENLIDYINRELQPAVRQMRDAVNDIYLPVVDNAPSANPLAFYFSTNTVNADPTAGFIRLNQATQDTATVIRVSESNARLVSVAPWLDVMAGGATSPLGVVTITDAINPARFLRFDLNTMTDQGSYWDLGVAIVESSHDNPFVDDGAVVISFIPGVSSAGTTVPPGSLTPIAAQSVLGNPTSSTAAPVAIALNDLSVLGRAGVLGTNVAGIDVPDTGTFTGESVFLRVASTRLAIQWRPWTLVDMPQASDNTFVGNISGATARPAYTGLGSLSSASVIYENVGKTFVREALSGDVVALQNNNTTTIQPNVVDNTKLADMAQSTVKGRAVGVGTGDPQDLTAAQVRAIVESAAISEVEETGAGPFNDYAPATAGARHIMASNAAGVFTGVSATNYVVGDWLIFSHQGTGYTEFQHNTGSATGNVFFTGRQGRNLRIFDNELAIFRYVDTSAGGTTVTRWELQSPLFPWAQSSADVAGDITMHNGTNYIAVQPYSTSIVRNGTTIERAALTGDVTAAQNGNATTITDDAVTNAKLANMAQSTIKGRAAAASTGDPQDLTASQVAAIVNSVSWTEVEETGAGPFNDYAPAGYPVHIMGSNAAGVFTGLVASPFVVGTIAVFSHQGTGYTELQHQSASSSTVNRFFNGRLGKHLRIHDNETAVYRLLDLSAGGTTSIRWELISPSFPYAQSDDDATGDIVAFNGTNYARITGGNSADVVLRGNATFGTVSNAAFRDSAALSVVGRAVNSTGDVADISASANDRLLARTSDSLAFQQLTDGMVPTNTLALTKLANILDNRFLGNISGATGAVTAVDFGSLNSTTIIYESTGKTLIRQALTGDVTASQNSNATTIANNAVTDSKLRDSAALSVIGRSANSTGDPADIAAPNDGDVLRRSGTSLGFGTVATAGIADAAVTLAKMANLAQSRIIGRAKSAGTGVPTALTPTQVMSIVDGENVTWTGTHAFNGTTLSASTSSDITLASGGTTTLAATTQVQITSPTRLASSISFDSVGTTASTAANDLAINSVSVVRFTGPVDPLTGMVPVVDGQTVLLVNAHASTNMGVHIESASSTAANRFAGVGTSRVIRPGEMALAWYDGTSDRWRLLCRDDVDL